MSAPARTVVLGDSDPHTAGMYRFRLEQLGYRVVAAPNAASLFAAVKQKPDVVVIEWERLGMSGDEVLERLKSDGLAEHVPVLVLTNHDMDIERHAFAAIGSGAHAWLVKAATTPDMLGRSVAEAIAQTGTS